ncbi:NAD-P-binding protein [Pluteus cervinus]|uniref:NAD-P-binding protein n=1 Tax=Pluteus cervinus TaxID=181527 RepID=A0ACD3APX9_9AGAR|nr:NAD-P-binding protein [Pluteus cervinus]
MDLNLTNVHVLVTGASGGIGLETAKLFLKHGARLTAHYNTNAVSLQPLLQEYGSERITLVQADLKSEEHIPRLFSDTHPVQVAIINHGIWPEADVPLRDMTLMQWKSTMDTNLTSSFLVAREYLRNLDNATEQEKENTAIVFIGSTAGKYGEAGHADYSASKSAMMYGLTLTLKNEIVKIAPKGRVNCVGPGWIKTPMAENALKDPAVVYRALATTPLRKVGLPYDVATQVVILSSSSVSGHVTGQVIMVEGGMEGRLLNVREDISGPGV